MVCFIDRAALTKKTYAYIFSLIFMGRSQKVEVLKQRCISIHLLLLPFHFIPISVSLAAVG